MEERNELEKFHSAGKKGLFWKFRRNLTVFGLIILVILIVACTMLIKDGRKKKEKLKELEATIEEMEKKRIQTDIIREEIKQISKYSAYENNYTSILFYSDQNQIFGIDIPLTENRLIATIDGKMNIGIDGEKVNFSTKTDAQGNVTEIHLSLPHSEILDNYTDQETLQIYDEKKNIFNPVKVADYSGLIVDSEKKEEEKVLRSDLLEKSDERIRQLMTSYLQGVYGEDIKINFEYTEAGHMEEKDE